MQPGEEQLFEISTNWSAASIREHANQILQKSDTEIVDVLQSRGIPETKAREIASIIRLQQVKADYKGAGSVPDTIAIVVTLTPVIHELVPLLQPFSDRAADLAYEIGLDIWEMVKTKLWHEHHIKLHRKGKAGSGRK